MNISTPDLVMIEQRGSVLHLTLNDAETGNALSTSMCVALAEALESINKRPDVHCVVLRGSGRHFCTGGNVKDMQKGADLMQGTPEEVLEGLRRYLHRITLAMQAVEVPVIAAINGSAIGAGLDLAMMCDLRVAVKGARLAESFLRLGLISGIGGAWFLTRAVGLAKAMEMTLTSQFHSAQEALEMGLVNRVVEVEDLENITAELARTIASAPPKALRLAKRLVRQAASSDLPQALETAGSVQAILLCGAEHKACVRAFLASTK
ncbi:enoyl-CoA hydratase-related protein [Pseudomonas fluorescens]|uniref:enoyl-CoA hydratase-related protein n=1 Tax=Pseudomonas fluorescens TaxID=294 RepID=UPI0019148024|nr:enoyl-CoA hydratase-related protein [Pseudomonas fluorescens]